MTSAALEWLIGAMGIKKGSRTVRKRIALPERVREIHAQGYLNPLNRVEEKKAELLVEQVERSTAWRNSASAWNCSLRTLSVVPLGSGTSCWNGCQ